VRRSTLTSRPDSLLCPLCEASKLYPSGRDSMRCESCDGCLSGAMLETLRVICALPDTLGTHACEECGHPQMRLLPDRTRHCPACGSEVLALEALGAQCSGEGGPGFRRSSHDHAALRKSEPTPNRRKEKVEGGDKE
jgi:RNA polymerase subunit RPABC4/transcription elongation factor Spt4